MSLLEQANNLLAQNKLKEAEFRFKALLEAQPGNGQAYFGLGRIAFRLERFDAAIYLLKNACKCLPGYVDPLFALADALDAVNDETGARHVLQRALDYAPENAEARYYMAEHLLAWGRIDEARSQLIKGLSCPESAVTLYILFELVQIDRQCDGYLDRLSERLAKYDHWRLTAVCHYAIGQCYDHKKEHGSAFTHIKKANELENEKSTSHSEQLIPLYRRIKSQFDKSYFGDLPVHWVSQINTVFIIGMPRCGATLLHQMLASHSLCAGMGGNSAIADKSVSFLESQTGKPFPACFDKEAVSKAQLQQAAKIYLTETHVHHTPGRYVINCLVDNFAYTGAILRLFPNAKVIDMRREFMPTAWSVYSHYFDRGESYFSSLSEFKRYHGLYESMMEHWHAVLPDKIYRLELEELLRDPEGQLEALFEFLHLKFEPDCLDYSCHFSQVHSLSKIQVRQTLDPDVNKAFKPYESLMLASMNEG